jgi:hypothetical protein
MNLKSVTVPMFGSLLMLEKGRGIWIEYLIVLTGFPWIANEVKLFHALIFKIFIML